MTAPELLQSDTEPLKVVVNSYPREQESSLSLLTAPQREFESVRVEQGSSVSENNQETGPLQTIWPNLQKKPKSAQLQALTTAYLSRVENVAVIFVKIGLAFVFSYAAIAMSLQPGSYIQFLPLFVQQVYDPLIVLHVFAIFEAVISIWLLLGEMFFFRHSHLVGIRRNAFLSSLTAFITIFVVTAVNLDSFSVVFRDVSIILSAFALVLMEWRRSKGISRPEPLSSHTPSVDNLQTTEPLLGLHKHWMSVHQQHIYVSLIFFAGGFSAITALAIALIGWAPLDIAAYVLVWPFLIIWLILSILHPKYGKLALKGFVIGLLACLFYDCMRFITIKLGMWSDFIPRINMLLFHTDKPNWVVGYIWRYVGDGGFMSVAFVVGYRLLRPKLDVRVAALLFGIVIWSCLVGTVLLTPQGKGTLFPLTPVTLSLSLLGHIIYGLSIGFLYPVFIRESVPTRQVKACPAELPEVSSQPQTAKEEAIVLHSSPTLRTGSRGGSFRTQFVKPGFIDAHYSREASLSLGKDP